MTEPTNPLQLNLFKAWSIGCDDTKVIFTNVGNLNKFHRPGVFVGFVRGSSLIDDNTRRHLQEFLENKENFAPATQLEILRDNYLGESVDLGCTIYWFTDAFLRKRELQFLKMPYTVMEIKIEEETDLEQTKPIKTLLDH